MKIRDIVREIVIAEFIDKQFNAHDIYEFVLKEGFTNIGFKQCRDAISGLQRMGSLRHFKNTPLVNSYFIATRSIYTSNPIKEERKAREIAKTKLAVYENKYLQLICDYKLIDGVDGRKFKGFDGKHSGRIERKSPRTYVGCSMELI